MLDSCKFWCHFNHGNLMYIPLYHEEKNLNVLHSLMQMHPLGAWVTTGKDGLIANHIPFVLDISRGEYGTLRAHVSRENSVWKELSTSSPSIVMFQGPQSYITPSWYPTKRVSGKVVPTWNYVVVHAHGIPAVIHDKDWILQSITDLTNQHESSKLDPWKVSDAPHEFISRLLNAIVGIEIPIEKLVGRWKLSQDEEMQNRVGTAAGLSELKDSNSVNLSKFVSECIYKAKADAKRD
jgi:transcriptional regulator